MDPLLIDDMEICFENLRLMEVIGEGAFGKVHRGEYQQEDGKMCTVAVKMLKGWCVKVSSGKLELKSYSGVFLQSSFFKKQHQMLSSSI